MAAFYASIPVGYVESGLRTYNLKAPFPEEFNRQITSKIAKWHFAPTKLSQNNLLKEGVDKSLISVTGNTVIDSLKWILKRIENDKDYKKKIVTNLDTNINFSWQNKKFVLITAHRRENFGNGMLQICSAISELASKYSDINFVYPVHLNPNVKEPVNKILKGFKNIYLIKPQQYELFIYLLKHSYLVLTDSGGIQEEAPSLGKPVLVMREVTERPEAIKAGTVELVGSSHHQIVNGVSRLLDDKNYYKTMSRSHNPYGDGKASNRIVNVIRKI